MNSFFSKLFSFFSFRSRNEENDNVEEKEIEQSPVTPKEEYDEIFIDIDNDGMDDIPFDINNVITEETLQNSTKKKVSKTKTKKTITCRHESCGKFGKPKRTFKDYSLRKSHEASVHYCDADQCPLGYHFGIRKTVKCSHRECTDKFLNNRLRDLHEKKIGPKHHPLCYSDPSKCTNFICIHVNNENYQKLYKTQTKYSNCMLITDDEDDSETIHEYIPIDHHHHQNHLKQTQPQETEIYEHNIATSQQEIENTQEQIIESTSMQIDDNLNINNNNIKEEDIDSCSNMNSNNEYSINIDLNSNIKFIEVELCPIQVIPEELVK
ncbi:D111/G-patch domain-containing protein [Tieghemostelium lacteum]|uniref:D111/G-patch domain-containing protein n=1 Tax=Tieghemostelium lacteum TaxID=361077 RepID=A0A152A4R4_TIELA|nr:D111/G-patch domain-containing protein [Tieghemostelium lacteum]|eukprot:KYR01075.1 D111/G-patch domain-containing protein [Tieghemostelium lacteum]